MSLVDGGGAGLDVEVVQAPIDVQRVGIQVVPSPGQGVDVGDRRQSRGPLVEVERGVAEQDVADHQGIGE